MAMRIHRPAEGIDRAGGNDDDDVDAGKNEPFSSEDGMTFESASLIVPVDSLNSDSLNLHLSTKIVNDYAV